MGAIKCPNCKKENEESAKICIYCHEFLNKTTILLDDADTAAALAPPISEGGKVKCPRCGHETDANANICDHCGVIMDIYTGMYTRLYNSRGRLAVGMNLLLFVRGVKEPFVLDAEAITQLVIGRFDPDTGQSPEINLDDFGAVEKGVSRRHASIVRRDGQLNIMDVGSANGTFLNGKRLVANQPHILRDGDDIRLGYLPLQVKYVRLQDSDE